MIALLKRWSGRLHVWCICREGGVGRDQAETRRVARREIEAVAESVTAHFKYQKSEQDILTERLGRRYDLGLALNEAANRAIEDKKVAADAPVLSGRQLQALKFQKDYLQHVVNRS